MLASIHLSILLFLAHIAVVFALPANLLDSVDSVVNDATEGSSSNYWLANIKRQGVAGNGTEYKIFRNVKDYGAKGDGSTDDTDAINKAISDGNRCGKGCDSSTTTPALVYIPPGTYVVSKPVIAYYYTQIVGDVLDLPVIKGSPEFSGMALIDSDPYTDQGDNWYTNQNNFFRSIRNLVIDMTGMPASSGAGIHWQVGQATDLRNIRFEMVKGGGDGNKQQGIFMDNGSGGFMADLVFNGGNYGVFLGNQQFTTRNMTFNDCNTAIFMNWNWAWTFKSININNCQTGLNMSNSPQNQTVGSILLLDSKLTNTQTGVVTAWKKEDSIPVGGGALILDNVDFSGSKAAVAGVDGNTILAGGSVIDNWVQGNTYTSSQGHKKRQDPNVKFLTQTVYHTVESCPASHSQHAAATSAPSPSSAIGQVPISSVVNAASTSVNSPVVPTSVPEPGSESSSSASNLPVVTPPSEHGPAGTPVVPSASSVHGTSDSAVHKPGTCSTESVSKARVQSALPSQAKPSSLVDHSGKVLERTKPAYENTPVSAFVSVKSAGAKGDGQTDDTEAIQKVLDNAKEDQIVYFDHGAYIITSTIKVPKNIKMVGEIWPMLMAHGKKFSDENNPIPMLQIGQPGDVGSIEISDLLLETKGPAPGAIMLEWNLAESSQGAAAMWDTHIRIGGSTGTELQSDKCSKTPKETTKPNPECVGAFMLFHATEKANAYIDNSWMWTADHELDLPDHNQINIYTGRGVLIESQGPVWMYGSSSEHNQLYNYQVANAKDIYMGFIQTETPYYQANPNALAPFKPQEKWNDPDFSSCKTESCKKSWGLRVIGTEDLYVVGAGMYSFFENYSQKCVNSEDCQENMVEVDCSKVHIYGLSTKASVNMVTAAGGQSLVPEDENESNFCSTIALFEL
ncbi:hypothetical protein PHISCL_02160 [Aspergillus sclerotialis]|uniref:Rhamnogalacturonase A/B/Epimerase-like pectate lyase domain-containing protein n=1 Tax=Aspergillus sclerotialis TaxID=2070753 RepID=A0A3A2ZVP4_9EURO|nr:hypothetical protein PHISCL_02160 [Aspergillus sclerotialis]